MRSCLRFLVLVATAVCPILACDSPVVEDENTRASAEAIKSTSHGAGTIAFVETTTTATPSPQPCGPGKTTGCYSNYVVTADLDGDSNLDLVFANGGNHFVPGGAEASVIYFGDGRGSFRDGGAAFVGLAASHVRQVAIGDVDGDGRLDVYFPGGYGLDDDQLFIQQADKTYKDQAASRLPGGGMRSNAGAAHLGDIDGDGDLDLLIADWGMYPNPDNAAVPPSAVTLRTEPCSSCRSAFPARLRAIKES